MCTHTNPTAMDMLWPVVCTFNESLGVKSAGVRMVGGVGSMVSCCVKQVVVVCQEGMPSHGELPPPCLARPGTMQ